MKATSRQRAAKYIAITITLLAEVIFQSGVAEASMEAFLKEAGAVATEQKKVFEKDEYAVPSGINACRQWLKNVTDSARMLHKIVMSASCTLNEVKDFSLSHLGTIKLLDRKKVQEIADKHGVAANFYKKDFGSSSTDIDCGLKEAAGASSAPIFDYQHLQKIYEYSDGGMGGKVYKVGKVLRGKCKGGDLVVVVGNYYDACSKESGVADQLFVDGTVNEIGNDSYQNRSFSCDYFFYALVKDNKFVFYKPPQQRNYGPTGAVLAAYPSRGSVYAAGTVDLLQIQMNGKELKYKGKPVELLPQSRYMHFGHGDQNFYWRLRNSPHKSKIPGYGYLVPEGRRMYLVGNDFMIREYPVKGIWLSHEGYGFAGFVPKSNARFTQKDFEPVKGEVNTYVPVKEAKFAFQQAYKEYLDLVKNFNEIDALRHRQRPKGLKEISFEDFMNPPPFVAKIDIAGRMQLFKRRMFIIPQSAEPIVYLYSDKSLEGVTLKLDDSIEVLVSDPPYREGWQVDVAGDGEIYDHGSQRKVSRLFWEGKSHVLPEWDSGWVVKGSDLKQFLEVKLHQYGLRGREITEFMNYWLPRLARYPWVKLRFFTDDFIKHYAPLHVDPKPDTVIRIHMDAEGTSNPSELPTPVAPMTPKRNGFTLVEWSGFVFDEMD